MELLWRIWDTESGECLEQLWDKCLAITYIKKYQMIDGGPNS
jgi:hypothetical protein